jgi:hypothetical protein
LIPSSSAVIAADSVPDSITISSTRLVAQGRTGGNDSDRVNRNSHIAFLACFGYRHGF